MSFKALNKALFDYGNTSLGYARRNLKIKGFAGKKRATQNTGAYADGLGFEIKERSDQLILNFTTKEKYGIFVEFGVNGTSKNRKSPYTFKSKFANIGAIKKYIKSPKFKLRKVYKNKMGQTVSKLVPKTAKNVDSAAFLMARSIAKEGIQKVPAVQKGSEQALGESTAALEQALAKDVKDILIFKLNKDGIKAS